MEAQVLPKQTKRPYVGPVTEMRDQSARREQNQKITNQPEPIQEASSSHNISLPTYVVTTPQ